MALPDHSISRSSPSSSTRRVRATRRRGGDRVTIPAGPRRQHLHWLVPVMLSAILAAASVPQIEAQDDGTLSDKDVAPAVGDEINTAQLSQPVAGGSSALYIIRMRSVPPVATYTGGIPGFDATAPAATAAAADLGAGVASLAQRAGRAGSRLAQRLPRIDLRRGPARAFAQMLGRMQKQVARDVGLATSRVLYSYKYASNAFAAELTPSQLRKLQRHPNVADVVANVAMRKLTTDSSEFLKLPETVWASAGGQGKAGEGVVIGIVDTGIWPEHPSFSDTNTTAPYGARPSTWRGVCQTTADFPRCNGKLIGARYLNAGFRAMTGAPESLTNDWRSARDADGHGTWCAGAAAGNAGVTVTTSRGQTIGTASGVAPRARLAVYKVFWSNEQSGGTTASFADIEAAVNLAVADGVDVLSLSLGGLDTSATYFNDISYLNANLAGVTVVYAAGNSGPPRDDSSVPSLFPPSHHPHPYLPYLPSLPILPPPIHSTISRRCAANLTLGDGTVVSTSGYGAGATPLTSTPLIEGTTARRSSISTTRADQCLPGALNATLVTGQIVICSYGGMSTGEKLNDLSSKGAKAVLMVNIPTALEPFTPYHELLPIAYLSAGDADRLRTYVRSTASPVATLAPSFSRLSAPTAPTLAYFSSTGPVANPYTTASLPKPTNDILKPDIIGPGVSLWAAWRSDSLSSASKPSFEAISGTSMATPHLAGIAALVMQKYPFWTPSQVISAIVTTATRTNIAGAPIVTPAGVTATPWDIGGGHVNPPRLLDPGLTYNAGAMDYYNFLAGLGLSKAKAMLPKGLKLAGIKPYDLNRPSISVGRLVKTVTVTRTVTNVANAMSTYTAMVVAPAGVAVVVSPNKLVLNKGASATFSVKLTVTAASWDFTYGSLTWKDAAGHSVVSVIACHAALQLLALPAPPHVAPCCSPRIALCCPAPHALLQPARCALLPCASRPAEASTSRPTAASASRPAALRVAPCCPARHALLKPARHALLPLALCPAAASASRPTAASARPAATTAAAAGGGGAAGSAGSAAGAGGAGGATRSAGGAAGAGGVDSGGHCLSRTTPPLSSLASGFFSEPVQVVEALRCVTGSFVAAALGASESAAALGASESVAALGASESAAALGASESAAALVARASPATGPSLAKALHTFTLDSGASRCFFRDCTTLTPLAALAPISLADPTGGPLVARASTVLPCPALPSGSLSGLHLPTFSTNLVSNAAIQDVWVDTFIPGGQRVAICMSSRTGYVRWLCRVTCLRLVSLQRLANVGYSPTKLLSGTTASVTPPCRVSATCTPVSLSLALPAPIGGTDQERYFLLVVDDYTRYTTVFPLQRKADVSGVLISWIRATRRQLRERFSQDLPDLRLHSDRGCEFSSDLRRIGLIMEVARTSMIHAAAPHFLWPFAVGYAAHQLNLWPRVSEPETWPTLRWTGKVGDASVFRVWGALSLVRNAKASKLSSRTLRCVFLGFPTNAPPWQFYHPHSRRVFSSQDVTFNESVYYYRLHPHVSHPVPLAPLFFVPVPPHVDPLPPHGPAPSCVSQVDSPPLVEPLEISYDSSGPAEGGDPAVDDAAATRRSLQLETPPGFPPQPSSHLRSLLMWTLELSLLMLCLGMLRQRVRVLGVLRQGVLVLRVLRLGAIRAWIIRRGSLGGGGYGPVGAGAASPRDTAGGIGGTGPTSLGGRAGAGGAGGAAGAGGAGAGGTGGAGAAGASGAVRVGGATGADGSGGTGGTAGAGGAGAAEASGTAGAGGAGGATGAASTGVAGAAGPWGARTRGAGAAGAGGTAGAAGDGGAGAASTALRISFFFPQPHSSRPPPDSILRQTSLTHSYCQPPRCLHLLLIEVNESLTEQHELETRASTPVHARRVAHPRPPAVLGTHGMALRPSSVPQRVVLPEPPASSLPHVPDPDSEIARAASPTVTRLLATVVTDPNLEFTAAFALVIELVDFAARSRLDYVASLVTEFESVYPPFVGGELALGSDVIEDRQFELECLAAALPRFASTLLCPEGDLDALDIPTPRSYTEAIAGEYFSQWQTAMDAEMAFWKSAGTYVDEVPPPGSNIVDGMWIFIVKRPSGSPRTFKAHYVSRGFSKRQGVDFFHTFSPTSKMTTLRMLLHVAAQRDYELHYLDFSTAFLQGSHHEEIWLRRPPSFTGSFCAGTQWSLRRPVYGLRQAPREWHDTLRTTLAALGFAPSSADPSFFLRTDTTLPPFYALVFVDGLVFATADTKALALVKAELQERHTCTDLGELRSYLGLQITRDRARRTITLNQSHMVHHVLQRFGFQFSSPQPIPLSTGHSLSAPPSDKSVEQSGPYPELVGCLITSGMGLVLGGQGSVVLTGHYDASWGNDQATQRSSQLRS
ncbi:unnamed protein product [Closterium sp. NIES-53]